MTVSMPSDVSTVVILLSDGQEAFIDQEDAHLVVGKPWCPFRHKRTTYATHRKWRDGKRETVYLHRLVMGNPPGIHIDHRDGNGLDCRKANLRQATRSQNAANARKRLDSRNAFKGVNQRPSGRWRARLFHDQRCLCLGTYVTEVEAARAYDGAARQIWGEFARLNFPD